MNYIITVEGVIIIRENVGRNRCCKSNIISTFTATITSTLTVTSLESSVEEVEDLKNIGRIGVVSQSVADGFLNQINISDAQLFNSTEKGLQALAAGQIEVLVHDKPVLKYFVKEHKMEGSIRIMPITFQEQYRSFLTPKSSSLVTDIDPILIDRINSISWEQTLRKYHLEDE